MDIEFWNLNDDPACDPQILTLELSQDGQNKPPSYCLPWVESSRVSIQLKANADYVIEKKSGKITGWIEAAGKPLPEKSIYLPVPEGQEFAPLDDEEYLQKKIRVSYSPHFSSPWQEQKAHSLTLKLGICWWTPPGWGLFVTSAIHRNDSFRVVEGFVRTDLWHRDLPILIRPLQEQVKIPKYSVVASVVPCPAEEIRLVPAIDREAKARELTEQISKKRVRPSIYKDMVLKKKD